MKKNITFIYSYDTTLVKIETPVLSNPAINLKEFEIPLVGLYIKSKNKSKVFDRVFWLAVWSSAPILASRKPSEES